MLASDWRPPGKSSADAHALLDRSSPPRRHGIYVSIGLENPTAAERFFDRIENKTHLLTLQPRMGMKRPDIRNNLRMVLDAPYLILYRIEPDDDTSPVTQAEIVRIVDGRRELSGLL